MTENATTGVIPLVFNFSDLIEGHGFVARIKTSGRAVVEQEEDGQWWVFGVNPGGVCAPGGSPVEALKTFRSTYTEVLQESAARCDGFGSFQADVDVIFGSTTDEMISIWKKEAIKLREGGSAGPLAELERKHVDHQRYIVIVSEIHTALAKPQPSSPEVFAQAA